MKTTPLAREQKQRREIHARLLREKIYIHLDDKRQEKVLDLQQLACSRVALSDGNPLFRVIEPAPKKWFNFFK